MHSGKHNKSSVNLKPQNWKNMIENSKSEYEQVDPASVEYAKLLSDKDTKVPYCSQTDDGSKLLSVSELKCNLKVFRINNMRLFAAFNSVLHFYSCKSRLDLCKLEYVYYKFSKCHAVERIINGKCLCLLKLYWLNRKSNHAWRRHLFDWRLQILLS